MGLRAPGCPGALLRPPEPPIALKRPFCGGVSRQGRVAATASLPPAICLDGTTVLFRGQKPRSEHRWMGSAARSIQRTRTLAGVVPGRLGGRHQLTRRHESPCRPLAFQWSSQHPGSGGCDGLRDPGPNGRPGSQEAASGAGGMCTGTLPPTEAGEGRSSRSRAVTAAAVAWVCPRPPIPLIMWPELCVPPAGGRFRPTCRTEGTRCSRRKHRGMPDPAGSCRLVSSCAADLWECRPALLAPGARARVQFPASPQFPCERGPRSHRQPGPRFFAHHRGAVWRKRSARGSVRSGT